MAATTNPQYIPYAGIGARATPMDALKTMTLMAAELERHGLTLRSGAADGADTAFERGVKDDQHKEIFLPWVRFNGHKSRLIDIPDEAFQMAAQFHPKWGYLRHDVQRLHARNAMQMLGENLDSPSLFVICWTPNGDITGGTGQSIRMANHYKIPVFNLAKLCTQSVGSRIEFLLEERQPNV